VDLVQLVRAVVADQDGMSGNHHFRVEADTEHLIGAFDTVGSSAWSTTWSATQSSTADGEPK
jgi:hypothetical protein